MDERSEPYEYLVFALSFQDPEALGYFAEHLPVAAVGAVQGQQGLREFYEALLYWYDSSGGLPPDVLTFREWLQHETDLFEALGGVQIVIPFLETIQKLDTAPKENVAATLNYRLKKRRQLDFLHELQGLVAKREKRSPDDEAQITYLTDQIRSLERDLDYSPLASVVTANDIAERVDDLFELPDFLPTQFKSLNRALGYTDTGGFCRGTVNAIIAQSGKGKSTLAKCLVNSWVDRGYTTLYINYEEAVAHWERVLFTQITKKNVYLGLAKPEEKEDLARMFTEKMREWGDRFMVRHDPDTPYFDDLELWLRDLIGHNEVLPHVIVIDTIQSLFMRGGGGKPRWGQFEEMMVRLEKLARDMNTVMIITAQENANRMKERRDVVMQTDTGGSLSIQQKCSVTIFITEKRIADQDDSIDEYIMELQIPKNRITGSSFKMKPPLVKYNDTTKSYDEITVEDVGSPEDYLKELLRDNP